MPYTAEEIISLTNQYRKSQGLPALKANSALMKAAQERARDMAKTGSFSHEVATTSPAYKGPLGFAEFMRKAGYQPQPGGENLATLWNDAPSMLKAWKASPKHNANLIKKDFQDIGVGIVPAEYNGKKTFFVVQFFGSTKPVSKSFVKDTNMAQPSPKKAQPTKVPRTTPDMRMALTTPQVGKRFPQPQPASLDILKNK